MPAVLSVRLGVQFHDLSLWFAELRTGLIGDHPASMEVIMARAMARGELRQKPLPARVVSLPFDLLRNEALG